MSHHEPIQLNEDLLTALMARYDDALAEDTPVDALDTAPLDSPGGPQPEWEDAKHCLEVLDRVRRRWSPRKPVEDDDRDAQPDRTADLRNRLGRFRIERELGCGGVGVVYLAYDTKLVRQVALKVPRVEALASIELRRRFLREAEAAARLNHPHIVTVFEAGEEGLICYIVAEYCPGLNLAQWLASQTTPIPLAQAAALTQQMAEAVQHAHGRGVLHRDIKPSNVLLTEGHPARPGTANGGHGKLHAKLTDFGMAKLLENSGNDTTTGSIIGTPTYMAPEQARGRTRDVDARADVYALGALLYELLTGRKAIEGESHVETLRRVVEHEPTPPQSIRRDIPRDFQAICLKCLAKDRDARYATAQELADDLQRYLRGLPTEAQPPRLVERLVKWVRRRPVIASLWGLLLAAMLTMAGGAVAYNARLARTAAELRVQSEVARVKEREAREYAYGADMMLAERAWENGAADDARQLLRRHLPADGEEDLRHFEWHSLWRRFEQDSAVVAEQPTQVWSLAVAPDGKHFATGDPLGMIRLWNLGSRSLVRELPGHGKGYIDRLLFLPDGKHLVSAGNDHTIRWWNIATGENTLVWKEHTDWVGALAMSPDGRWLVSGAGDGRVLLWDVEKRSLDRELYCHPGAVRWAVFSPQRSWVVSACEAGEVRIWDYERMQSPAPYPSGLLELPPRNSTSLMWRNAAFRPDGRALFANERDRIVEWNFYEDQTPDKQVAVFKAFTDRPLSLELMSSAGLLVEGGDHEPGIATRRVKKLTRVVHDLHGHSDSVRCLAALPHETTLLSGSEDGTVRIWDLAETDPEGRLVNLGDSAHVLAWSPRSDRLWIVTNREQIQALDDLENLSVVDSGEQLGSVRWILPFESQGQALAIGRGGMCHRFDQDSMRTSFEIPSDVSAAAINSTGSHLACGTNSEVVLLRTSDGTIIWRTDVGIPPQALVFVPGDALVAGCGTGSGMLYRLALSDGRIACRGLELRGGVNGLDAAEDGRRLVVGSNDRTVRIVDADTLTQTAVFSRPRNPFRVWFIDHDHRLLVVDRECASVVHPVTGQDVLTLFGDYPPATEVSPDGRWLAKERKRTLSLVRLRWD